MVACVIGGGIAGTLTAYELQRRAMRPYVLEAEVPGAATPASAGMLFCIRDWAHDSLWETLAREGRGRYRKLCAGAESSTGFERRGLLVLGADVTNLAQRARQQGDAVEVLTPEACRERYPQLAPLQEDAVLLPDIAQIDPKAFLQHIRKTLQSHGMQWETAQVAEICHENGVVMGVSDGQREWTADQVVLAAGAWSTKIFPQAPTEITPRRGQIVVWREVDTTGLPIILEDDQYLVSRADGTLLAGATNETVEFDVGTTPEAGAQLTEFAQRWYPGLSDMPDEQWSGLRPCGAQDGPLFGASSEIRGLYFNTGHYRHGIVCAPATARRLVDELIGEASP